MAGFVGNGWVVKGNGAGARSACSFNRRERVQVFANLELEKLVNQLKLDHVLKRERAQNKLIELNDPESYPMLMELLDITDVMSRRAASQTLGKLGTSTVPWVINMLEDDSISPVQRATCVKTLSAIIVYNPQLREEFPAKTVEQVGDHLENSDMVTRLASSVCLGLLASPGRGRAAASKPNARAMELLETCVMESTEGGIIPSVVMQLGAVANAGGAEYKERVRKVLEASLGREGEYEGSEYVDQVIKSELEKLTKSLLPE